MARTTPASTLEIVSEVGMKNVKPYGIPPGQSVAYTAWPCSVVARVVIQADNSGTV